MQNYFRIIFSVAALIALSATPALADKDWHHDKHNSHWNHNKWNHNYHPKNSLSISLFSSTPGYYHSYYPYYPHYYTVAKPIYVTQPIYVQPQPVVQQVIFANASGYQTDTGQYCREYQALVFVGGQKQNGYGTACYQPDGSWKVID
jgi:hypothetical protein